MDIQNLTREERRELGRQIGSLSRSELYVILDAVVKTHEARDCYTLISWHLAKSVELIAAQMRFSQEQVAG